MSSVFERIQQAENDLGMIKNKVTRLAVTLGELKEEASPQEIEVPIQTPPPLPPEPVQKEEVIDLESLAKPLPIAQPEPVAPEMPSGSGLELQLGRVWFVRIGIVLLITGFVFLSHYSYNAFIHDLGPGVRLSLLYLLSATTAGAGLFFERSKKSLQSYGRIVAAGGLAAIYYCSFAASHVAPLKVISSPVLGSILLTGSAGLLCAMALWRQSRVMLSTSLGLAFYSVSITPPGWLALFSAAILTAFGIAMMVRTRWMETGFVVMAGSYLSYIWWQIAGGGVSDGLPWFLAGYWALFTASSFVSAKTMKSELHTLFCGINHAAFFLLFSFNFSTGQWIDGQWLFALILGATLPCLAFAGREIFPRETTMLQLIKGIGLITLGISLKLSGYQLFLSLLIESVMLMAIGLRRPQAFSKIASYIIATLAGLLSLSLLTQGPPSSASVWLVAILLWLTLAILDRRMSQSTSGQTPLLAPAVFALMAQLSFIFGLMTGWELPDRILTIGAIGLLSLAGLHYQKARTLIHEILLINVVLVFPTLLTGLGHDVFISPALMAVLGLLMTIGHFLRDQKAELYWESGAHRPLGGLHLLLAVVNIGTAISTSNLLPGAQFLQGDWPKALRA